PLAFVAAGERIRSRIAGRQEEVAAASGDGGEALADVLLEVRSILARAETPSWPHTAAAPGHTESPHAGGTRELFRRVRRLPELYLVQSPADPGCASRLLACLEALARRRGGSADPFPAHVILPLDADGDEEGRAQRDLSRRILRWIELALDRGLASSCVVLGGRTRPSDASPCGASLASTAKLLSMLADAEIAGAMSSLLPSAGPALPAAAEEGAEEPPPARIIAAGIASFQWRPDEIREELTRALLAGAWSRLAWSSDETAATADPPAALRSAACGLLDRLFGEDGDVVVGESRLRQGLVSWLRSPGPAGGSAGPGWRERMRALAGEVRRREEHLERAILDGERGAAAPTARGRGAGGARGAPGARGQMHFYLPFFLVAAVVCASAAVLGGVSIVYLLTAVILLIIATVFVGSLSSQRHGARADGGRGWLRRGRRRGSASAGQDAAAASAPVCSGDPLRRLSALRLEARRLADMRREIESLDASATALRDALAPFSTPRPEEPASGEFERALFSAREIEEWFRARGGEAAAGGLADEVFARLGSGEGAPRVTEWLQREAREWAGQAVQDIDPESLQRALGRPDDAWRQRLERLAAPRAAAEDPQGSTLFVCQGDLRRLARPGDILRDGPGEATCIRWVCPARVEDALGV
ncbi:MAG: hypothetical protein JXA90_02805, partial [Planctomycetes bacterium]|nr:hypothetical protein [Planctomycetota bacterium]